MLCCTGKGTVCGHKSAPCGNARGPHAVLSQPKGQPLTYSITWQAVCPALTLRHYVTKLCHDHQAILLSLNLRKEGRACTAQVRIC